MKRTNRVDFGRLEVKLAWARMWGIEADVLLKVAQKRLERIKKG